jgi:hypothetical protein
MATISKSTDQLGEADFIDFIVFSLLLLDALRRHIEVGMAPAKANYDVEVTKS